MLHMSPLIHLSFEITDSSRRVKIILEHTFVLILGMPTLCCNIGVASGVGTNCIFLCGYFLRARNWKEIFLSFSLSTTCRSRERSTRTFTVEMAFDDASSGIHPKTVATKMICEVTWAAQRKISWSQRNR